MCCIFVVCWVFSTWTLRGTWRSPWGRGTSSSTSRRSRGGTSTWPRPWWRETRRSLTLARWGGWGLVEDCLTCLVTGTGRDEEDVQLGWVVSRADTREKVWWSRPGSLLPGQGGGALWARGCPGGQEPLSLQVRSLRQVHHWRPAGSQEQQRLSVS